AGEAAIGEQSAGFTQAFGFDVAGGIEHFLHAGAALGAFVADDDDIASLDLVVEDVVYSLILRFGDMGVAFENQDAVVHACGFDDAAVERDVAGEDGQAAFGGEGVLKRADAAFGAVEVEAGPAGVLAEGNLR